MHPAVRKYNKVIEAEGSALITWQAATDKQRFTALNRATLVRAMLRTAENDELSERASYAALLEMHNDNQLSPEATNAVKVLKKFPSKNTLVNWTRAFDKCKPSADGLLVSLRDHSGNSAVSYAYCRI